MGPEGDLDARIVNQRLSQAVWRKDVVSDNRKEVGAQLAVIVFAISAPEKRVVRSDTKSRTLADGHVRGADRPRRFLAHVHCRLDLAERSGFLGKRAIRGDGLDGRPGAGATRGAVRTAALSESLR